VEKPGFLLVALCAVISRSGNVWGQWPVPAPLIASASGDSETDQAPSLPSDGDWDIL
jgi:hypothetical protein